MDTMAKRLDGKRVAVLAANGFEHIELVLPCRALRLAGARVEVVSLHRGKLRGMSLTEATGSVSVDKTLEEASADDYDALLVPGGFIGPDLLRQSRLARDFVRAFDAANKPIAALCHAPWLLVSAELVSGRHLAAWPGIRDDIVHAGGVWHDLALVSDRNWVTSRGPQDLPAFIAAMIELFATGSLSRERASTRPHDGESSAKAERPYALVVLAARLIPGPTVRRLLASAVGAAVGLLIVRRVSALVA
jgi:protease I